MKQISVLLFPFVLFLSTLSFGIPKRALLLDEGMQKLSLFDFSENNTI